MAIKTPGVSSHLNLKMDLEVSYNKKAVALNETVQNTCSFVLRFYSPVNPMGSCQAQSVYLTTCLLGRLSLLSG